MPRPTMTAIAERAGVSVTTVSRALLNSPEISLPTTRRIQEIAAEIGYVHNSVEKRLRSRNTRRIGLVVADNSNPFFGTVIKGIENTLALSGYGLILCNSDELYRKERNALNMLTGHGVDGILVTPAQSRGEDIADLRNTDVPIVLVGRRFRDLDVDSVVADDAGGAFAATEHLIRLGHRDILFLNGPEYISSAQDRLEGYRNALTANGIESNPAMVRSCVPKMESAYNAMRSLIVEQLKLTAVFTFNDLMAMGALRALKEADVRVPEHVSIVGFDDIEFVSLIDPPLTTMHVHRYEMGAESAKLLLSRIDGSSKTHHLVLPTELMVRHSTRKLDATH
jgi:LacI family transcriptional regulator, galactose operon repressor